MSNYFNWKTLLILAALIIVSMSLYFTNNLAKNLAIEEKKKVEQIVAAIKTANSNANGGIELAVTILDHNTTIPLIITNEKEVISDFKNIDFKGNTDTNAYLIKKRDAFAALNPPLISDYGTGKSMVYFGESYLLTELRYFPYIQITVIALFLLVVLNTIRTVNKSLQNRVWVGLSKETAHQLGTPLSSITGWLELLKEEEKNKEAVAEMEKDLNRLQLVADRFSKIGSVPQLKEENLMPRLRAIVDYMQKRASSKVVMLLSTNDTDIPVNISGPLLDWVFENLIRNALDAMDGKGNITINVVNEPQHVIIDVIDTGKGIDKNEIKKVFNPGFSTKTRGWGLGLSLAKRIIQEYHHSSIFVKQSEVGKGTTFRIILLR